MGAALALMAQMCADVVLRDKMINAGIVQRAIPLLQYNATRKIALGALAILTQFKSSTATTHLIALSSPELASLALSRPEDCPTVELVVIVLAQTLRVTLIAADLPSASFLERLQLPTVVEAIQSILRRPRVSFSIITHAIDMFAALTLYRPPPRMDMPSLTPFLTAFARCNNIRTRAIAISGVMRLPVTENPGIPPLFSQSRLEESVHRGVPEHLACPLMEFGPGPMKTDILVIIDSSYKYRCAMAEAEANRESDLCSLGRRLADLVQVHDFAIGDKLVDISPSQHPPRTAPFTSWIDCLHLCSQALRSQLNPSLTDLDAADVLEMRFLYYRGHLDSVFSIARAAIQRSPDLAYAYFFLGMQDGREESLRMARRGLLCPQMTPFVRTQLLCRTATHAAHLGFALLRSPSPYGIEEGVALVEAALHDTDTFLEEASPDNLWRLLILDWKIILTVLTKGPELSHELSELEFIEFIGYDIAPRQLNAARDLLLSSSTSGYQEWDHVVKRYDEFDRSLRTYAQSPVPDLWFTQIGSCNVEYMPQRDDHTFRLHPSEMYKCSWCNKPSSVLRKCGRCGQTVYCNSNCQRLHWDTHKAACVRGL
ncbi:hypothetical protein OH76DRAFT_675907 [Lentinus brumalis]|uniref:MYND-type domain-containing protein n=1 Tax=Lentinus brumalis TaxID=2498619 RepID=A0A371CH40_9APHY|nr:hypothetical protein OH76DRAFT_675907 [Polyporus brumalis]